METLEQRHLSPAPGLELSLPPERSSAGAMIGLFIIVVLLGGGGLYLWSESLPAARETSRNTVPVIPASDTATIEYSTTTAPVAQ